MPIHTKPEMGDFKGFLAVSPPPSPSPSPTDKSKLAILCYGLVVVGTAAIVLAVYSLIIIKRRGRRHLQSQPNVLVEVVTASSSTENSQRSFLSSFKYKKEAAGKEVGVGGGDDDYECPVCLSAYEEGEEVRKLPRCKHCFHAPCIDMWLHSHFDCPICRTPVRTFCHISPENSRQRLVESGGASV